MSDITQAFKLKSGLITLVGTQASHVKMWRAAAGSPSCLLSQLQYACHALGAACEIAFAQSPQPALGQCHQVRRTQLPCICQPKWSAGLACHVTCRLCLCAQSASVPVKAMPSEETAKQPKLAWAALSGCCLLCAGNSITRSCL